VFSGSVATAIAALLGIASVQFVMTERDSGNVFIGRVPLWIVEIILPIGFLIVAFRLWKHASYSRTGRAVVAFLVE